MDDMSENGIVETCYGVDGMMIPVAGGWWLVIWPVVPTFFDQILRFAVGACVPCLTDGVIVILRWLLLLL